MDEKAGLFTCQYLSVGTLAHRPKLCTIILLAGALISVTACGQVAPRGRVIMPLQNRPIDEKLFDAIRKNDVKEVTRLLSKGANPQATEANDWPAIVVAASSSLDIVKVLLSKGAKINARQSDQGWTPLTQALTSGRTEIVLYLLSKGADPALPMTDGLTPLHLAVRSGNSKSVEALLKRKVNVEARTKESPNSFHRPDLDERTDNAFEPGYRDSGHTPLFELVPDWKAHPQIAKMLLDAGADPKAKDDNGWTLLHEAVKFGTAFTIQQALKLGIDPNARSRQGFTPLHVAMRVGFGVPVVPVIKSLLAAGANAGIKNAQGQTPEDLLRADAARMLASLNLSPAAGQASADMRYALRAFNDGLQALRPGAEPIAFPEAPVVDGWSVYPPVGLSFGDESRSRIEHKVRSDSGGTQLSLTYKPSKAGPAVIKIDALELNTYEPLEKSLPVLTANKEVLIAFPAQAGPLGGAVWLKYSYSEANASGSGIVDGLAIPNPGFVDEVTSKGKRFAVYCRGNMRPLEFRIDKLSANGMELTEYRGKIVLIKPPSGDSQPYSDLQKDATHLITIKRGPKGYPRLNLLYSFRLLGNKTWRTGNNMPLGGN